MKGLTMTMLYADLRNLADEVHAENAKWWVDIATGESTLETRPRLSLLMLVVTEVTEYVDGLMSGKADEHLQQWQNSSIELGDIAIRLLDMIGAEDRVAGTHHTAKIALACEGMLTAMNLISVLALAAEAWRKERTAVYRSALNSALQVVCMIADSTGVDLAQAIGDKRRFNRQRADHKIEARLAVGGKKE